MKPEVLFSNWIAAPLWLRFGLWLERKGLDSLAASCLSNASLGSGKTAVEAAFRLSQSLLAKDQSQEALAVCERGLALNPDHARLWCAMGAAQRRLARMDEALVCYRKAVELAPDYARAWCNLGEWSLLRGDSQDALEKLARALELEPNLVEALINRVAALYELGRFEEAETVAREAIDKHPDKAQLHVNLGNVLLHSGKSRLATESYRKALECDPACPEAHMNLANILGESGRLAEALAIIEHEIELKGETAQRLATLAMAQKAKGEWLEAEETCRKVLDKQANNVCALITLAGCVSARAEHEEANGLFSQAMQQNPAMSGILSNIAFTSTYMAGLTAEEIYARHREWVEFFERDRPDSVHTHGREAARPLRIGYVSGDFGTHPVGFLLRDVIRQHDHDQFSICCYSMMRGNGDQITEAIRQAADEWVEVFFLNDDELVERIREDQIDILVDLSGHTAYGRLPVFVRRPAPVQVTWIGYFHSTGLDSIDYFITDPHTSPKACGQWFSEIPLCLPHSRFCYSPPPYACAVVPPPMLMQGQVTFGCFNRLEKLVDPVLAAWAEILQAVPGSRLILKAGPLHDERMCEVWRQRFASFGVEGERLELRGSSPHPLMLEEYGEIDIALDPFPFNGGMTTLEALWMGVAVVTVEGQGVVSRQSVSALRNLGLPELIYPDVEAYIRGAVAWANNPEGLTELRQGLRARMSASPLCQPEVFTRDLEALYRKMWQAWCRGERLPSDL